jgi:hypothetical protein
MFDKNVSTAPWNLKIWDESLFRLVSNRKTGIGASKLLIKESGLSSKLFQTSTFQQAHTFWDGKSGQIFKQISLALTTLLVCYWFIGVVGFTKYGRNSTKNLWLSHKSQWPI